MSVLNPHPERAGRLAQRLRAAERRCFVGRAAEMELFDEALRDGEPRFAVLHLHGPGGVGKSMLLGEYVRLVEAAGSAAVRVDGRSIEPSPTGFLLALSQAMGLPESASPLAVLGESPRRVLLIDTYEMLAPLDDWLRDSFLPELTDRSIVVIAGRQAPDAAWRTDPAWCDLVRIVSLRNLPPDDSRAYLRVRAIPAAGHESALAFTHGHPLALALVADLLARGDQPTFSPGGAPDVMRVLLDRFVEQVPSIAHRRALEVCARTRVTTETLLADVLGSADAPALFDWLRGLSFIEDGPEGLFPHDVAREVLDADLRWRDPGSFRDLHRRVLRFLVRRLQSQSGRDQQRAYFDVLFLSRNSPVMRPFYDWQAMGTASAEPARAEDLPDILAMVRRHEGEASERIAAHWIERRPHGCFAFRSAAGQLTGFLLQLTLDIADPEEGAIDPAVDAARQFVRRAGPPRPGERLWHLRFWMSRAGYQDLAAVTLAAALGGTRWLTTPGLAWTFLATAEPDFWSPTCDAIGFPHAPDADFEVGGRRYGVFAHDWRREPPLEWIERKGLIELTDDVGAVAEPVTRPTLVVLSEPDFEAAVRQALRDYTRPQALTANPLLRSRLVVEHGGGAPTAATLQELLRDAAATLRGNPKDEKLYRALVRTYLEPAATQELAAEVLGLPFSTYRYHLTAGLGRVTEWLWRRELYGPDPATS